jgi:hypothetical protein
MNFSSDISKRIIKALERLLQKANLKNPQVYDRPQIISKAVLYGIPYNEAFENLVELADLIHKYETLLKEADVNGIVWDLTVYDPERLRQKIHEEQQNKEKLAVMKNLNMTDKICTPFELQKFAHSEYHPTAFNFARFIESKSDKKYTVINRQFVFDALDAFKKQASFSNNLKEEFIKKWKSFIELL